MRLVFIRLTKKNMPDCLYCYAALKSGETDHHRHCNLAFFGSEHAPVFPYALSEIETLAKESVSLSVSVPGVQPKLSLGLIKTAIENGHYGRLTILDALEGNYIVKPPNPDYPMMPENEHLSMKLAVLFSMETAPANLIRLQSGELCYITKRMDRNADGTKNHMIDFLQIMELEDKYKGTMEMLGKNIGKLSVNTLLDKMRFFESVVFNFIIGNNDMHLKNFSMLLTENGWVLAPFYDLLNVQLVLPGDPEETALLPGGKKKNFNRGYFDRLGESLKLNQKQIQSVYRRLQRWLPAASALIDRSFLNQDRKTQYKSMITTRSVLFGLNG